MLQPSPEIVASKVLEPGETLLWAGRPDRVAYVWYGFSIALMVFGLVWTSMCIYILTHVLSMAIGASENTVSEADGTPASPWSAVGIIIAFMLPGAFALATPLIRSIRRRRMIYAVTNLRVMTLLTGGDSNDKVVSVKGHHVATAQVFRLWGPAGHIVIVERMGADESDELLVGVPNAAHVANLLKMGLHREGHWHIPQAVAGRSTPHPGGRED